MPEQDDRCRGDDAPDQVRARAESLLQCLRELQAQAPSRDLQDAIQKLEAWRAKYLPAKR